MMGYNMYGSAVTGGNLLGLMITMIVLVDLILLGAWLWKQLQKKK